MRPVWALLICTVALAQAPIEQAIRLAREKKYAEARLELRGVAEPPEPRPRLAFHRLKAAIASGLGEHEEAAREMHEALALAPGDSNLRLATAVAETVVGDSLEQHGHYVEAAQAYQRAIELAPAVEQYRLNLALELVRHATFEPAATVLEQAAAMFPRSPRIKTLFGVAYYALAKVDEAVVSLVAALDADPQFQPAREYLTRVTLDAQTPDVRAVDALCRQPDAVCAAARLRANRDDAAAFADLERLAKPGDGSMRCELARAYDWRQQWVAARAEMEDCVKFAPDNPQHHYRLARIYQRLGLTDLARREADLQKETTRRASEEVERREQAVQAFQYVVKQ